MGQRTQSFAESLASWRFLKVQRVLDCMDPRVYKSPVLGVVAGS